MAKNLTIFSMVLLCFFANTTYAQSNGNKFYNGKGSRYDMFDEHRITLHLKKVSDIDIEPAGSVHLIMKNHSEPGLRLRKASNASKWLNYTSSLEIGGNSKSIVVHISGILPEGIEIIVKPGVYTGNGKGQFGKSMGEIKLTTIPQIIISGVGACYTGSGPGNGHNLEYHLKVKDYSSLSSCEAESILVTYTITD